MRDELQQPPYGARVRAGRRVESGGEEGAAGGGAADLLGDQGKFDQSLARVAVFLGQARVESAELGRQAPERGVDILLLIGLRPQGLRRGAIVEPVARHRTQHRLLIVELEVHESPPESRAVASVTVSQH